MQEQTDKVSSTRRNRLVVSVLDAVVALLVAFAIGGVCIALIGVNPLEAYSVIVRSSFGSVKAASETLVKAIPIALCGLGVAIAFKTNTFNIGAEGQLLMGAVGTTFIGTAFYGLSPVLLVPLVFAFSFLAGAAWGAIPGVLKAKLNVNEIFVSLFLNYVAFFTASYLVHGPWKDPAAFLPHSRAIDPAATLPTVVPGTRLHAGLFAVVVLAVLVYMFLQKTVMGYEFRVVGSSLGAARLAGVDIAKCIIIAMILSGGIAGLAGYSEVAGIHYRLRDDLSPAGYYGLGYGYIGIGAALFGMLNPFGVVLASVLYSAVIIGSGATQITLGVPVWISYLIIAITIIIVLTRETLGRKLGLTRRLGLE
jgi:simple sugar transport system permease protein